MSTNGQWPGKHQGFFEIRMESIGGLGANVAGHILAEAGVLHAGFNGSNFSTYGSEKKGSPVTSFVRFAPGDRPLRDSAPVEQPQVLAIFHEALLGNLQNLIRTLLPNSIVIVNSRRSPEEVADEIGFVSGKLGTLPALDIAVDEGSRVNMAMLGAVTGACEFLDPEMVVETLNTTLGARYPRLLPANLRAFRRGYETTTWVRRESSAEQPRYGIDPSGPLRGYLTAPRGGVITEAGNTAHRDLSSSRHGFLPEFLREQCIDCALCDLVCPDLCFVWEETTDKRGRPTMALRGIDYQYCKGCMKCIEICPTDALISLAESDGWAAQHRVPHPWNAAKEGSCEVAVTAEGHNPQGSAGKGR